MNDLFAEAPAHDPGGKTRLRMKAGWVVDANFGGEGHCYRYMLSHVWDPEKPMAMWLMMNPSVADHRILDPTVAKTCRVSAALGYGGQFIANVCAYRATDRLRLLEVSDPVGPSNHQHVVAMARSSGIIVVAHGLLPGDLQRHADATCRLLLDNGHKPHVLRLTKDGAPSHPLYIPDATVPQPWPGPMRPA